MQRFYGKGFFCKDDKSLISDTYTDTLLYFLLLFFMSRVTTYLVFCKKALDSSKDHWLGKRVLQRQQFPIRDYRCKLPDLLSIGRFGEPRHAMGHAKGHIVVLKCLEIMF